MTQSETVLNHLTNNRKITSIEAIGLYGITRLAAVIYKLKKQNHEITSEMKEGVNAPYAEYRLGW
jgi:hypothetical protein